MIIALVVSLWACSHLQTPVSAEGQETTIEMTASNFKFEPNNITTRTGNKLTFNIKNISGTLHNFTLKDPNGVIMQNIDIPPEKSVQIKIAFPQPRQLYVPLQQNRTYGTGYEGAGRCVGWLEHSRDSFTDTGELPCLPLWSSPPEKRNLW